MQGILQVLIVSQFKKEVHFSGTFGAVKIAEQFVTIWFIATCKNGMQFSME